MIFRWPCHDNKFKRISKQKFPQVRVTVMFEQMMRQIYKKNFDSMGGDQKPPYHDFMANLLRPNSECFSHLKLSKRSKKALPTWYHTMKVFGPRPNYQSFFINVHNFTSLLSANTKLRGRSSVLRGAENSRLRERHKVTRFTNICIFSCKNYIVSTDIL